MDWIVHQLRVHPELAIFLTLFVGFWIGKIKIGKFSLCLWGLRSRLPQHRLLLSGLCLWLPLFLPRS